MSAPADAAVPAARAVGLYLAGVQFLFALGWIIYALYLPELAEQVGLERRFVPWILALDQLVFVLTDLAVGIWSDRAAAVQGRIARAVLAATLVSAAAFLWLPWLAPGGSAALFLGATLVWAVGSSALRAPPLTLLGRYVARPLQPGMVALVAFGLGLAQAASPYLGLLLKGIDPRWPFVLAALSLAAVTLGMSAAERALRRGAGASAAPAPPRAAMPERAPAGAVFLLACLLAAASFQVHVYLASAPLYLKHAAPSQLTSLLPVFWIGFNLALWPAGRWARRVGAPWSLAVGAVAGALGVGIAHVAGSLPLLVAAQLLAGAAWGLMLCSAFVAALQFGHTGREGLFNGSLQSILALAALSRLIVVLWIAPTPGELRAWAGAPALVFAAAAILLVAGLARARGWPALPGAQGSR